MIVLQPCGYPFDELSLVNAWRFGESKMEFRRKRELKLASKKYFAILSRAPLRTLNQPNSGKFSKTKLEKTRYRSSHVLFYTM